jgi:hypothetical protein
MTTPAGYISSDYVNVDVKVDTEQEEYRLELPIHGGLTPICSAFCPGYQRYPTLQHLSYKPEYLNNIDLRTWTSFTRDIQDARLINFREYSNIPSMLIIFFASFQIGAVIVQLSSNTQLAASMATLAACILQNICMFRHYRDVAIPNMRQAIESWKPEMTTRGYQVDYEVNVHSSCCCIPQHVAHVVFRKLAHSLP